MDVKSRRSIFTIVLVLAVLGGIGWGLFHQPGTPSGDDSSQGAPTTPAAEPEPAVPSPGAFPDEHAPGSDVARWEESMRSGAHRDHDPKHGGTFFMSTDNAHHLEGVLVPPDRFCVYLYDAHTVPLDLARLQEASGLVQWGESDDAPQTPLTVSANRECLETTLGHDVKFPVTLALLLRLPGLPSSAKMELFTLPFSHFSAVPTESAKRAGESQPHSPEQK